MGSKKFLPENSVKKLISCENKPVFTEIAFFFFLNGKTHFHTVKGIINAFDHMELCLVINLTLVVTGLLNDHQCLH